MNESILLDLQKIREKIQTAGWEISEWHNNSGTLKLIDEAIKKWEDSSGKETGKDTVAGMIKKYETYYDNIEWHIRTNEPLKEEVEKLNRMLDDFMEIINDLKGLSVPPYKEEGDKELEQLRQWKKEAIAVMPDFQKIGQLIGVKLGESVHDKIIPFIEKLLGSKEEAGEPKSSQTQSPE